MEDDYITLPQAERILEDLYETLSRVQVEGTRRTRARLYARRSDDAVMSAIGQRKQRSREGFGQLLQLERERFGADPVTLARDAKLNDRTVAHLEDGTVFPTVEEVWILSLLLRRPSNGDVSEARQLEADFLALLGDLVQPARPARARTKQIALLIETGNTDTEERGLLSREEYLARVEPFKREIAERRASISAEREKYGFPGL